MVEEGTKSSYYYYLLTNRTRTLDCECRVEERQRVKTANQRKSEAEQLGTDSMLTFQLALTPSILKCRTISPPQVSACYKIWRTWLNHSYY